MIAIKFKGWFQCRLATDPDPSDEPRGVSGYMKALPGEPDLDRIIRFHDPLVERSHTPTAGVFIEEVAHNNHVLTDHELVGKRFNLLENPKFYGFNAIVEDDGFEPIVPVVVSIEDDQNSISRNLSDMEPKYPFAEYKLNSVIGKGYTAPDGAIIFEASDIFHQTGIYNPSQFIEDRIKLLENDLKTEKDEIEIYNLNSRIKFLKTGSATQFFAARMHWNLRLNGKIENNLSYLKIDDEKETWRLNFWMGAWDPDAQNGFVSGALIMPGVTFV